MTALSIFFYTVALGCMLVCLVMDRGYKYSTRVSGRWLTAAWVALLAGVLSILL